jgi:alkylation response protein AidB-like acyl-CoA dehydrogenase
MDTARANFIQGSFPGGCAAQFRPAGAIVASTHFDRLRGLSYASRSDLVRHSFEPYLIQPLQRRSRQRAARAESSGVEQAVDLRFSEEDEAFRREISDWLADNLAGEFAAVRGRGGPGDEHALFEERHAWERRLGEAGWTCVGWPREHGGRSLPLSQQMIFYEEYARAGGPGRVGHIGEGLAGPTIIAFGDDDQHQRFLPGIVSGEDVWCQGYSEPNAGSDLANVQTRAELVDGEWRITGQKVWTSGAAWSNWCFVLCRTDPEAAPAHRGISYLLVPMLQEGIEVRPIVQLTGDSEFSEVFFDGARTAENNVVGGVNGGWKVAMGTLAFERGASTLGQQMQFQNELEQIIALAKRNGAAENPVMRQRIADAWIGLRIMRFNALRTLNDVDGGELPREAMITKIYWATWHRELGKLAMDVLGPESELVGQPPYDLTQLQRMYLFTRSDTIYAGSNEIQRNIIAERALGMPREPRPTSAR